MDKILWADDEIDLLKPHILFLKAKGYDLTTVSNGRDALDALDHDAYSLVLLDENMPGISGLETLDLINARHPDVPVVMITKSEEENIMDQAIGNRIADYLIKPVNPNQILLSIKKNLHSREITNVTASTDYQQEFTKISQQINMAASIQDWMEIYRGLVRWELKLSETASPMEEMLLMQKRDANSNFCKFVKRNYADWLADEDHPLMSHEIFRKRVFPLLDQGEKVCMMVIDNFRLDQWRVVQPLLSEYFNASEELYTTILPTSTQYARNAIFAGLMPYDIAGMYPQYWVEEDEDEGLNVHEEELIRTQLERFRRKESFQYTKLNDSPAGEKFLQRLNATRDLPLQVVVINFIDMLSHARTESKMIRELASNDAAYRSITESWFRHSSALDIFRRLSELGYKVIVTTDHGTIRVDNPIKVIGDRNTNTNLRYKCGKNLSYNTKQVFEIRNPRKFGLPTPNISSAYIFAMNEDFFSYPNNYNYYVQYYTGTFQHGGISLQEMLVPLVTMTPKG
ncbi:MAG: bifunctional response regulator/alkaline phosphatase family protein [Muribaculaceae bacterium]|nr:bifunctional response regulator/alkaline phosphatase family protein [Bacteroidales bacterium]MDY2733693.1 bifunctional response regulator/alkaline phosphatase family protein [Muribaculaceae bacterium]MDY5388585.1 bifunctional response regulator/alkaline phosphatase family protein [Muribaculaceae bacterium]